MLTNDMMIIYNANEKLNTLAMRTSFISQRTIISSIKSKISPERERKRRSMNSMHTEVIASFETTDILEKKRSSMHMHIITSDETKHSFSFVSDIFLSLSTRKVIFFSFSLGEIRREKEMNYESND